MGKLVSPLLSLLLVPLGIAYAQADPSRLLSVKRICVDKLVAEGATADAARELAIASLFASKRFAVTEKCEAADAVLKGAVVEKSGFKSQSEGEATSFGAAGGRADRYSAAIGAVGFGSAEKLGSAETRWSASVSIRLVDKDGDVLWAHSFDSPGGKAKGALADAVERAVKQLLRDVERLSRPAGSPAENPPGK